MLSCGLMFAGQVVVAAAGVVCLGRYLALSDQSVLPAAGVGAGGRVAARRRSALGHLPSHSDAAGQQSGRHSDGDSTDTAAGQNEAGVEKRGKQGR